MGSCSSRVPATCAQQVTLTATGDGVQAAVGPLSLDGNGVDLCLHLDATQLANAHFWATSDNEWDAPPSTTTDVVLWVHAVSGTEPTMVSLALIAPIPD